MLQAAVERKLDLGEAAHAVSDGFQEDHPEIPLRIISQRHFLAHEYGEVRQESLCALRRVRIPELIERLEELIPPVP